MTGWNIDGALPATQQRFAVDLFRAIRSDRVTGNVVCSPFSVWCALLMAWMGARGEMATALTAALHLDGLDRERILRGIGPYIRVETRSRDGAVIEIASGIWINAKGALGGAKFQQSYTDQVDAVLNAKTTSCDFESSAAVIEINGWIRDRTKGRIDQLLDKSISGIEALLINAASFDGVWANPFKAELTTVEPFHCRDGRSVSTPMMRKTRDTCYAESSLPSWTRRGQRPRTLFAAAQERGGPELSDYRGRDESFTRSLRFCIRHTERHNLAAEVSKPSEYRSDNHTGDDGIGSRF